MWLELWATGVVDIGLSEERFWTITPSEWNALIDRLHLRADFLDQQIASIKHMLFSINKKEGVADRPRSDFALVQKEKTQEELDALLDHQFRMMAGM